MDIKTLANKVVDMCNAGQNFDVMERLSML